MTPLTRWYGNGYGEVLTCPQCGFDRTHIVAVTVVARHEDQDGTRTRVETEHPGRHTVTHTPASTIGGRRHNTTLTVSCEVCEATTDITFEQHKGQTFVTRTAR